MAYMLLCVAAVSTARLVCDAYHDALHGWAALGGNGAVLVDMCWDPVNAVGLAARPACYVGRRTCRGCNRSAPHSAGALTAGNSSRSPRLACSTHKAAPIVSTCHFETQRAGA